MILLLVATISLTRMLTNFNDVKITKSTPKRPKFFQNLSTLTKQIGVKQEIQQQKMTVAGL